MRASWHGPNRLWLWWAWVLVASLTVGVPLRWAVAAERARSATSQEEIAARLIPQLGSGVFAVREAATNQLMKMGIEVKPALLAAMDDPDAEIRVRVRSVLASVVDSDFQRRLVLFAEDVNDQKHYELPGWSRYRELVGSDRAARNLFVEMQRSEMSLMEALEIGREAADRILEGRIRAAQMSYQVPFGRMPASNVSMGSVAALLFVGSDTEVNLSEAYALQLGSLTNYQPMFQQAIAGGSQSALLRKILGAWIKRDLSPAVTSQNVYLAVRYELKECLEPAVRLLQQPGASPMMKPFALLAVARFGGKEHLPLVESQMTATDVCSQTNVNGVVYMTQLRDIALFAAVQLAGQRPKDFGFTRISGTEPLISQTASIGFWSNADREAALKKWNDWRGANIPSGDKKKGTGRS
jgi:hypothetical protein